MLPFIYQHTGFRLCASFFALIAQTPFVVPKGAKGRADIGSVKPYLLGYASLPMIIL